MGKRIHPQGYKRERGMFPYVLPVGETQTQAMCMYIPTKHILLSVDPELETDHTSSHVGQM